MAQYHHVVFYDTATESWGIDTQTDAYFPDGEVWNYAGSQEWSGVPDAEEDAYQRQAYQIIENLNAFPFDQEGTS